MNAPPKITLKENSHVNKLSIANDTTSCYSLGHAIISLRQALSPTVR